MSLHEYIVLEAEGLEIHYLSSYGFSGITVDEVSEQQRREENEDLAAHPAAFHPAVQLLHTHLASSRAQKEEVLWAALWRTEP